MHQRPPLASGPPMAPTPTPSRTSRPANPSTRTASDQGTSNSFSTVSSITPSTPSTPKDKGKGRHPAKSAISMLHYLKLRKPHLAEPGDYLTNEILDSHLVGFEDAWFVVSQGSYPGIYYGRWERTLLIPLPSNPPNLWSLGLKQGLAWATHLQVAFMCFRISSKQRVFFLMLLWIIC